MKVYFYYDTDGYFLGNGTEQKENSTEIEPTFKVGYWQKFNGKKWVNEKISDSAKDIEDVSVPDISYEDVSATNHQKELYAFFQKFLDDSHYIEKKETEKTLTFKAYSDSELLDKVKAEKLAELTAITSKFDNQLVNTDMIIKSSLGFSINADLRSQNNLRGLISVGIEPVNFMDATNSAQSLTLEQLNVLLNEAIKNGENLYKTKWELRNKILNSSSVEELNSIKFNFVMLDFSVS